MISGAVWKGTIYSIAIPGLPCNWAFRNNNGTLYLTQRKHGPVPNPKPSIISTILVIVVGQTRLVHLSTIKRENMSKRNMPHCVAWLKESLDHVEKQFFCRTETITSSWGSKDSFFASSVMITEQTCSHLYATVLNERLFSGIAY